MLVTSIQGNELSLLTAKQGESSAKPTDPVAESKTYYFSPALVIDPKTGTDVLEYRNSSTGTVINQYPSERDLQAYQQHSLKQDQPPVESSTTAAPATSGSATPVVATNNDAQTKAATASAAEVSAAPAATQTSTTTILA